MSRLVQPWIVAAATTVATAIGLSPARALAQLDYTTYRFGTSTFTGVTGIRGDNMTGNYAIPNAGGPTGGLLFNSTFTSVVPFPTATGQGQSAMKPCAL